MNLPPKHLYLLPETLHLNLIYGMLALYLHILDGLYILEHSALKDLLLQLSHLIGQAVFMYSFNYFNPTDFLNFLKSCLQLLT